MVVFLGTDRAIPGPLPVGAGGGCGEGAVGRPGRGAVSRARTADSALDAARRAGAAGAAAVVVSQPRLRPGTVAALALACLARGLAALAVPAVLRAVLAGVVAVAAAGARAVGRALCGYRG